jgi:hypothetical protein
MINYNDSAALLTFEEENLNSVDAMLTHEQETRNDATKTLLAFTLHTRPNYQVNWHHEHLAMMLDRIASGQCRRLMVFMPPQHGKSELVSRRIPSSSTTMGRTRWRCVCGNR